MRKFTIKAEPFSWNENLSEVALEDFSMIQKSLSYGTCQTIGMALAKLGLMEKKGLNPDTVDKILERLEAELSKKHKLFLREDRDEIRYFYEMQMLKEAIEILKEEVGYDDSRRTDVD